MISLEPFQEVRGYERTSKRRSGAARPNYERLSRKYSTTTRQACPEFVTFAEPASTRPTRQKELSIEFWRAVVLSCFSHCWAGCAENRGKRLLIRNMGILLVRF